jgi:hypothetical protein
MVLDRLELTPLFRPRFYPIVHALPAKSLRVVDEG